MGASRFVFFRGGGGELAPQHAEAPHVQSCLRFRTTDFEEVKDGGGNRCMPLELQVHCRVN